MSDLLRDPDLDRLVEQLNQGEGKPLPTRPDATPRLVPARLSRVDEGEPLEGLLAEMSRRGASDLLLVAERPPVFRVDGRLLAAERAALDDAEIRSLFAAYSSERIRHQLETAGSADFSLRLASGAGTG